MHARGAAGGGGHVEMVFRDAAGDAVIEHHAVFAAHEAVAALAGLQLGPGVGVDHVEEPGGIRALDVDLAEGRGVDDADGVAGRLHFAVDRVMHALAGLRIVPGAVPLADAARTARRARHAIDASASCGSGRGSRLVRARRTRRRSPACRAGGRWWCRLPGSRRCCRPAMIASALTLLVLPWSVAMPIVV